MSSTYLKTDQPELYAEVAPMAANVPDLADAIDDYEEAGAQLKKLHPEDNDWRDWTDIQEELLHEIRRLLRLSCRDVL